MILNMPMFREEYPYLVVKQWEQAIGWLADTGHMI